VIPALLVALALVDAMFCGFRDAAGRRLHIDKRAYYRAAIRRGILAGILAVLILGALAAALLMAASDPAALYATMTEAGRWMVWIYGAYAALVLVALLAYLVPDSDVSTLATVVILGPFTMLRPWVIWAGAAAAIAAAREPRTALLAALAATALSTLQRLLGLSWRNGGDPLAESLTSGRTPRKDSAYHDSARRRT
jgi:hypothetical protein